MFKSVVLKQVVKLMNKELPAVIEDEFYGLIQETNAMVDIYQNLALDIAFSSNPIISDT